MIYEFEGNRFYNSLSEIDENEYSFYREGCLVAPKKVEFILKNDSNSVLVAKKKKKAETEDPRWSE